MVGVLVGVRYYQLLFLFITNTIDQVYIRYLLLINHWFLSNGTVWQSQVSSILTYISQYYHEIYIDLNYEVKDRLLTTMYM